MGDFLVHWTARLAIGCYAARALVDAAQRGDRRQRAARWLWTIGCGAYLLHVLAAFHFVHDWSHAAAYAHTARQTAAVIGWEWGGGLWANYALTAVWAADVAVWWGRGRAPTPAARAWGWFVHAFLAFMVLNATVVFGPWWWKPLAAGYAALLAAAWRQGVSRKLAPP
ncbi:MAG: hypothetical protein WD069_00185 [Planctomycetales bacterium]